MGPVSEFVLRRHPLHGVTESDATPSADLAALAPPTLAPPSSSSRTATGTATAAANLAQGAPKSQLTEGNSADFQTWSGT